MMGEVKGKGGLLHLFLISAPPLRQEVASRLLLGQRKILDKFWGRWP